MGNIKKTDHRKHREKLFREKMRERRRELGITQSQLASQSGVSVDLIRAIEGGRSSNPSFFIALDILKALKISFVDMEEWIGNDR